jgi:hypothetical protein
MVKIKKQKQNREMKKKTKKHDTTGSNYALTTPYLSEQEL